MRCLCLFRYGPMGGSRARDAFDLMLTLAAFDQEVEVLLLDDGVWQLLPGQRSEGGVADMVMPPWSELGLYGIGSPWVETESLRERNLGPRSLAGPVREMGRDSVAHFLRSFDRIMED